MHILGTCGDAPTHIDLLDFIIMGGTVSTLGVYVKYNWRKLISKINGWFGERTKRGN